MKVVGIDIGSYSIKVAIVENLSQNITISGFQEYALSVDPTKDKDIEIIEALRRIKGQFGDSEEVNFICGLPAHQVSIHRLIQPPAPRFKILESIPYALADISPLDPEDALYDIRILKTHPNAHDVLAIAARRDSISKALERFYDGGVDPNILTVQGLSTNNVFESVFTAPVKVSTPVDFDDFELDEDGAKPTEQVVHPEIAKEFASGEAVISLGHQSTTLIVRKEGGLVECREISWGGHDLVTAICDEYKIHYHEGLQMLHKSGILLLKEASPSADINRLSNTLKKAMLPLVKEVQLSLLEVKSKYTVQVRAIGLLGGTSRLRNLGPYLTQNLQIACNMVTQIHQFEQLNFKSENSPIAHMGALGIALEGLRKPRNPALDLRKDEFSISNENLKVFFEQWSYSLQLLGLAFIAVLCWSVLRSNWSYELSDLSLRRMKETGMQVTGLPRPQANVARLKRYIKTSDERQNLLKKLQSLDSYRQASFFLRELHSRAPRPERLKIDIETLDITNNRLFIQGKAESTAQLLGLEEVLKELSTQGKITRRTVAESDSEGKTPFEYEIGINPFPHN